MTQSLDPLQNPQKKEDTPRPVTLDFDPDASRAAIERRLADALQNQNAGRAVRAVAAEPVRPAAVPVANIPPRTKPSPSRMTAARISSPN